GHHEKDQEYEADVDEWDHVHIIVFVIGARLPGELDLDRLERLRLVLDAVRLDLGQKDGEGGQVAETLPVGAAGGAEPVVVQQPALLHTVGDDRVGHFAIDGVALDNPD